MNARLIAAIGRKTPVFGNNKRPAKCGHVAFRHVA